MSDGLNFLSSAKVMICVGSGGVGKTTVAAAMGALAAYQGKNVLVLTIDPSRRLKSTLGLPESGDIVEVPLPGLSNGKLFAAIINAKATFDGFVKGAVEKSGLTPEIAQKILNNKLYYQLSTTLSGSQEFTALEKLYSCFETGTYDLIILDTPPTKHAIDFLEAPQKLAALFNDRVAQWLRAPGGKGRGLMSGILHAGTVQVMKAVELLTGADFMTELRDFFQNIEAWQSKLEDRVTAVHRLLVSRETNFSLVTSFDEAKLKEAEFFAREIRKGGYKLSAVLINRAYPNWLKPDLSQISGRTGLEKMYLKMSAFVKEKQIAYGAFEQRMSSQCEVYKLPEMEQDISDIQGILRLTEFLKQGLK